MATIVRNTDPMASVICAAVNDVKAQIGAGSSFHLDKFERTIASANASDLATSIALCIELRAFYAAHRVDTLSHKVADTTDVASQAAVVDLASAITVANDLKAKYNTHRASTTYHYNADATNTITSADATDLASLETLLNEMKTDIAAHTQSGPAAASLRLVDA